MFLLPLIPIVAIALTIWFVVVSEASTLAKGLIAVLLIVSLVCRYTRFGLIGFFLQAALSVFVLLYLKARSP